MMNIFEKIKIQTVSGLIRVDITRKQFSELSEKAQKFIKFNCNKTGKYCFITHTNDGTLDCTMKVPAEKTALVQFFCRPI